ncbi:MAG TPA: hypothetical protein VMS17_00605 [Gemmataceae bacterium]|nr:hypothetical protein [Gemmataceae bacterium]
MKRLLITGGRAAAALELARLFRAAGWRVVVAESLPWHPSRWSRAVARSYVIPWPNRDPPGCIDALRHIIQTERIDLLIPTCEEIFTIAKGYEHLAPYCTVFAENIDKLHRLHSKWLFVQTAQRHRLAAPPTILLTNPEEAQQALASGRDLVFKPVYSRFAAHTVVRPRTRAELPAAVSERRPWVAQDYVPGRQICTYSVAHTGRLTVHSAYLAEFTFGLGAAVAHAALDHPTSRAWVEAFVRAERFTGQMAFDFIETPDGRLFAIECNPRTTSGVHLFADDAAFVPAFLGETAHPLQPRRGRASMYALLMAAQLPRSVRSWRRFRRWGAAILGARDVFFRGDDLWPFIGQFLTFAALHRRARRFGVSLTEASTLDIEWNGDR